MSIDFKHQGIMFIVMVVVGVCFNPMNMLAYRFDDLYMALTLFYGGLLMASNMIWAHQIVHFISHGMMNTTLFMVGICATIAFTLLIRSQLLVDDEQWLRRMISHHSTALTTSHKIYDRTNDNDVKQLSKEIIDAQEKEIAQMKGILTK